MLSLRAYFTLGLISVCATPATPALAWQPAVGSPPGWRSQWVQATERTTLYAAATDDIAVGNVPATTYYRVDAPALAGRLWVYNPLSEGWAWLPRASTVPVDEPTPEQVHASATDNPREYLYARAPDLAPRLDCIISGESGWDPNQRNPRSGAAGLAQFLPGTWATTPQGQLGLSPYDPESSIDAAIWLAQTRGWTPWEVYTRGRCQA